MIVKIFMTSCVLLVLSIIIAKTLMATCNLTGGEENFLTWMVIISFFASIASLLAVIWVD